MRRALLSCVAALTAAAAAASIAAGATEPPRATLRYPVCTQAPDSLDRAVAITAVMRPQNGTEQMQLQFNLLEKPAGRHSYSEVKGGDLGKWVTPPNATLGQRPDDVWNRQKLVVNLAAPVVYRFHVGFRWTGAHGLSLGRQYLWAPVCSQR